MQSERSLIVLCRWTGNNGPEQTDLIAMRNLIEATPKSVKRFVLTTSAGVDRSNKIPFSILNLFGKEFTTMPITACFVMAYICHSFM